MSKVVNPLTNRKIKVGSALHKKLCKDVRVKIAGCSDVLSLEDKFLKRMMEIKQYSLREAKKENREKELFKSKFKHCDLYENFRDDPELLEKCMLEDPFDPYMFRRKDVEKVKKKREKYVPMLRKEILKKVRQGNMTERQQEKLYYKYHLDETRPSWETGNVNFWQPQRGRNVDKLKKDIEQMKREIKSLRAEDKKKKKAKTKKTIKIKIKNKKN